MWEPQTISDLVDRIEQISRDFRTTWLRYQATPRYREDLEELSRDGVAFLRALAIAVRSEQDYNRIPEPGANVGALTRRATRTELERLISGYQPPFEALPGFEPLSLREGLNKIVHVDRARTSFYADADTHHLILSGDRSGRRWIVVLSVLDLCEVVRSLPDAPLPSEATSELESRN